jgi:hypothetical protein
MKLMELWRWRYRDTQTGEICRTPFQMTAAQAVQFAEAERIPAACAWFASRTISSTPCPVSSTRRRTPDALHAGPVRR